MIQNTNKKGNLKEPPKEYERIIQKLEADIRGHIRLEHEMKIHMDYLEAKVEKFEKEHKSNDGEISKLTTKIEQLQEKMDLLKSDRDDQVKQSKRLKAKNEELKLELRDLQIRNDEMAQQLGQLNLNPITSNSANYPGG